MNQIMYKRAKIKKQAGFTLIELVIVIVILGSLAVVAIPKFLALTEQAKQANIEAMAGGFATGVSLARAQWEVEGRPHDASDNNRVDYDGTTVYLTVQSANVRPGYILGTSVLSAVANVECLQVWNAILQQPPSASESDLAVDSSIDYFVSKDNSNLCHYYLKASLARDVNNSTLYADPSHSTTVGNSFTYDPSNSEIIVYIKN